MNCLPAGVLRPRTANAGGKPPAPPAGCAGPAAYGYPMESSNEFPFSKPESPAAGLSLGKPRYSYLRVQYPSRLADAQNSA